LGRGRPAKGKPRTPAGNEYQLHLKIVPDPGLVEPLHIQAGCFVLISSIDSPKELDNFSAGELLRLYKNQDGIDYRLERQTDDQANFFYDDNQVSQHTSFESRTLAPASAAVNHISVGIS
jgi:hypothetical protein